MITTDPLAFLGRDFIDYVAACAPGLVDEALVDPSHNAHARVAAGVDD